MRGRKIQYFRCAHCGFIRTEPPDWIKEAYSEVIPSSDIGSVHRSLMAARVAAGLILTAFNPHSQFIDEGGGYGLFVRLMRDEGFDFWWSDPYCKNLFAMGYEATPEKQYELLTAFEVFEHFLDPEAELARLRKRAKAILLSTTLLPDPVPHPNDWPYFGCEHGQHLSLYTAEALHQLARRQGLVVTIGPREFHLLTPGPVRPWVQLTLRPRGGWLASKVLKRLRGIRTLQQHDAVAACRSEKANWFLKIW